MKNAFRSSITIVLLTAALFLLASCGTESASEKTTYADLSEADSEIIDYIYYHLDQWETDDTSTMYFNSYEEKSAFITYELDSIDYGQHCIFKRKNYYIYDLSNSYFAYEDSDFIRQDVFFTEGTFKDNVDKFHTKVWDITWTESEKKDYLAHMLVD